MAKVTINKMSVEDKDSNLAAFLSNLTKTERLGDTIISCAEYIAELSPITVNAEFEGESDGLYALADMAASDAVVSIVDSGDTPRPRVTTWENIVKLAAAAVRAYPASRKIRTIGEDVKGLVTFENTGKKVTTSTGKSINTALRF